MTLSIGWRANDVRESIWKGDTSLVNVPAGALAAWQEDGDTSHLEPYATLGKPTIIRWRALNADQKPIAQAPMTDAENNWEGANRAWIRCFRMAVTIDGMEESTKDATGERRRLTVREKGIPMMALEVVDELQDRYPGMVQFYGHLVYMASFLSDVEKKSIIAAVHADAIVGGGVHGGHYGAVSSCGGCDGCPVSMREQWSCPDLGPPKPDGLLYPIPGSTQEFAECPAYFLRTGNERPAEHLIEGITHPAHMVSEWAFEVESGARLIDSLSLKGREAVHLFVGEKAMRDRYADDMKRGKRGGAK